MYATGTPTSLSDFLNALNTFAVSAGWTSDFNGVPHFSGASDYYLAVHKDSCFLGYYVPNTAALGGSLQIQLWGATAYAGSTQPSAQAGAPALPTLLFPPPVGPYAGYHFFSTATAGVDYLHTLLEYSAGNFLHLDGGRLNPVGGASPATYTAGTCWSALAGGNSSLDSGPAGNNWTPFSAEGSGAGTGQRSCNLLCTVDGTARWFNNGNATPARLIGGWKTGSKNLHAFFRNPNTFNQLTPFIPLSLFVERAIGNVYSCIGDVIDMRVVNLQNNQPKDEITIGSDTWKLFPVISKQPLGSPTAATSILGYAFRKNA
jgi:hypothetical protein